MKKWEIHDTHANEDPDEIFSMSVNDLKARILFATNVPIDVTLHVRQLR